MPLYDDQSYTRPAFSEPQDQEISEFNVVPKRRATDFEATKSWKDRSGNSFIHTSKKQCMERRKALCGCKK